MNAPTAHSSRLMRPAVLVSLIVFSFVLFSQPQAAEAADANVDVGDIWFCQSGGACNTFIEAGDTVTWDWVGFLPHNVVECGENWSKGPTCSLDGGPDWQSTIKTSGSFNIPFDTPGVTYYLCTVHGIAMSGTINVASVVGGIAELPSATAFAIGSPDSTSNGPQLLIAIAAFGAAAVAAFGSALWYMRRRLA